MSREFDLCKIVKIGLGALKRARIPLYWSKYSRGNTSGFPYLLQPGDMLVYYADKTYDTLRNIRFVLEQGGTP